MSTSQRVPLSLVFEGQSWLLTMFLHTTLAIGLIMLLADRKEFWKVGFDRSDWTKELLFHAVCMVAAAYGAAVAVAALWLNSSPVHNDNWRSRAFWSGAALMLIDVTVIEGLYYTVRLFSEDTNAVASRTATVFITVVGVGFTIGFNLIYLSMFGCCVCLQCRRNANAKLLAQQWGPRNSRFLGTQLTLPKFTPQKPMPMQKEQPSHRRESLSEETPSFIRKVRSAPESQRNEGQSNLSPSSSTSQSPNHQSTPNRDGLDSPFSENRYQRHCSCPGEISVRPPPLRDLRRMDLGKWSTQRLVEAGSFALSRTMRSRSPSTQCEIIVEEPEEMAQEEMTSGEIEPEKSSKATVSGPDIAEIVHRSLSTEQVSSFKLSKLSLKNLWNAVREDPGHFRYVVWIKSAFLTSVVVLIYTCIRTMSVLYSFSNLYEDNRKKVVDNVNQLKDDNEDAFNEFFKQLEWEEGIPSILKTVVGQLYLVVDALVRDLKFTVWPGYTVGTIVGLCSLVAVLIQHKRISLAVTDGLRAVHDEATVRDQEMESPWPSFQRKYPVLGACFFLAILTSTAVIQLHVVGFTVSVLLGLVMHVSKLTVFMNLFGFYLLAYVLVCLIDVVAMHLFAASLISQDGSQIKHPRWFNFIIVVLSMVHLVIGLLYALWRALYLLITTIFVLNRLDVSLFTIGKSLDNGHNAFMSMLVLTVLIQEDHDNFSRKSLKAQLADKEATAPSVHTNEATGMPRHKIDKEISGSDSLGNDQSFTRDADHEKNTLTLAGTPFHSNGLFRLNSTESVSPRNDLQNGTSSFDMDPRAGARFMSPATWSHRMTVLIDKEVRICSEKSENPDRQHLTKSFSAQ